MIMIEHALKALKLERLEFCGSSRLASRLGKLQDFHADRERVVICGGSTYRTSLRLAYITCLDSAKSPVPSKRKAKVYNFSLDGPTKTELKLLKDLQDFIASCDLPPNAVPTTAELTRYGRKDLANRVRRKGYKQVEYLLKQVRIADTDEITHIECVTVPPSASVEGNVTGHDDVGVSSVDNENAVSADVEEPNDGASSFGGAFQALRGTGKTANLNGHASSSEKLVGEASGEEVVHVPESESNQRIRKEVSEFALQLKSFQDSLKDTNRDNTGSTELAIYPSAITNGDSADRSGEAEMDNDQDDESYDDEAMDDDARQIFDRPAAASQPDDIVYKKAALLKVKLVQYFDSRSDDFKEASSLSNSNRTKEKEAHQEDAQTDLGPSQSEVTQSPKDLEQLKALLHARELELAQVSKQLEEAKALLSLARAKATAELVHVKQLTFDQDVRLQAADQALSSMKQVHMEWFGEASRVELAGSFNGWQHCILLEPDFTSEIPKPDGGRGPMMWGTFLCLYPGVYEIKFIIDGNWQVDHRREVVTRHSNQNNLLRVE